MEVQPPTPATARILASVGHVVVHAPVLPMVDRKGVPALATASVLVHLATRPTQVRSWASTAEWLPDLAADTDTDDERSIATCRGQDRPLALRMLQHLPGQRLHDVGPY